MFFPIAAEAEVALEKIVEAGVVAEDFAEDEGLFFPGDHGQGAVWGVAVGEPDDLAIAGAQKKVEVRGLEGSFALDGRRGASGNGEEFGDSTRDLEGRSDSPGAGEEMAADLFGEEPHFLESAGTAWVLREALGIGSLGLDSFGIENGEGSGPDRGDPGTPREGRGEGGMEGMGPGGGNPLTQEFLISGKQLPFSRHEGPIPLALIHQTKGPFKADLQLNPVGDQAAGGQLIDPGDPSQALKPTAIGGRVEEREALSTGLEVFSEKSSGHGGFEPIRPMPLKGHPSRIKAVGGPPRGDLHELFP